MAKTMLPLTLNYEDGTSDTFYPVDPDHARRIIAQAEKRIQTFHFG